MISANDLFDLAKEGLLLAILLCVPVLGAVALSSLASAFLQLFTKMTDATFSQIFRIVGGAVALVVTGPWIVNRAVHFAERAWSLLSAIHP